MANSGKKARVSKPDPGRGGCFRTLLELDEHDNGLLAGLLERYQDVLDDQPVRSKVSKAFVIRQLLRHAAGMKSLPPLR